VLQRSRMQSGRVHRDHTCTRMLAMCSWWELWPTQQVTTHEFAGCVALLTATLTQLHYLTVDMVWNQHSTGSTSCLSTLLCLSTKQVQCCTPHCS
jgi:hypothetical protein